MRFFPLCFLLLGCNPRSEPIDRMHASRPRKRCSSFVNYRCGSVDASGVCTGHERLRAIIEISEVVREHLVVRWVCCEFRGAGVFWFIQQMLGDLLILCTPLYFSFFLFLSCLRMLLVSWLIVDWAINWDFVYLIREIFWQMNVSQRRFSSFGILIHSFEFRMLVFRSQNSWKFFLQNFRI